MILGYARISTTEQAAGLAGQERDLKVAGCERGILGTGFIRRHPRRADGAKPVARRLGIADVPTG
jgi:DNA invertase Pin-like site-specific DNA recombinase